MGILNVTPDSFADGGLFYEREKAIAHGLAMARDGADIIDIGGESTRPYAKKVSLEEELDRVIPVIEALRRDIEIPICIDTFKAEVARQALLAGASMINDISALRFDEDMVAVCGDAGVPLIVMHMKGTPSDMQDNPTYDDLISDILGFLKDVLDRAVAGGIERDMIIVDPGLGFGKTLNHNLEIIKELRQLRALDRPVLLGSSRKSFLGLLLNKEPPERDTGTMATLTAGILNGAHIVRVHDVKKAVETAIVTDAVQRGRAAV
ncbi:MAG: dihydropteroate synthase [Deltaproteobacteria bacterium]|nr:dihydropteroate synthase [Deltaproteobacteria bacterium]